ncbi:MAG: uracil-DNA glycosylase [Chloroflexota bacterium]|nr:uracil-DNA glycosylase [Chloroflexota bacterium]
MHERAIDFAGLVARARACERCPRMAGRTRVLGPGNGPLDARILFVAEAPGRLGGDRTGVPLSADQTGRNFDQFLAAAGLERGAVFVTNAVLCNPRGERGLNDRPRAAELRNCSAHLADAIAIADPPWVVALGRVALDALGLIAPHDAQLARDVGTAIPWAGRRLVPLYHPGPRSVARRGRACHVEDYRRLAALVSSSQLNTLR